MSGDNKPKKIDVSSTAVEKGIDIAKGFVDKLVSPPIEELGLLVKDQISYWRFKNQINILNKAKSICEKNNVSVKAIPPKLLCPYLENASLEEDDELQEKWANLLVNMVDSKQNIENHVFPYILGQLSKDEFNLLENVLAEKRERVLVLTNELTDFLANKESLENELKAKLKYITKKLDDVSPGGKMVFTDDARKLRSDLGSVRRELRMLGYKESLLNRRISSPQDIPDGDIKEFEMANIIRLGLAKVVFEASAGSHSIDVPIDEGDSYASVDFDIDIETESTTILTELGELFVDACQVKNA